MLDTNEAYLLLVICVCVWGSLVKKIVYKLYIFGLRLDLFLVHLYKYIWVKNVDKILYCMKTKGLFHEPWFIHIINIYWVAIRARLWVSHARPIPVLVTWKAIAIIVTLPLARLKITLVWILFLCQVKVLSYLDLFFSVTLIWRIVESVDQY